MISLPQSASSWLGAVALGLLVWDLAAPLAWPPARHPGRTAPSPPRRSLARRPLTISLPEAVAALVGAVALTLITIASPVLAFVTLSLVAGVVTHRRRVGRRSATEARDAALPELIDALVALIRSGLTPSLAWRELPACTPPALDASVRRVIAAIDRGSSFADALADVVDELGSSARALLDVLVTADRYGLPLVPALDRLSSDAAAERRRLAEARSRQLPVRMSLPLVVCTLPAFTLLGIVPILAATLSSLRRP